MRLAGFNEGFMSEKIASTTSEKIQLTSELIFAQILEEDGFDLEQVRQKMEWSSPICDWALGYLLGEGDIEITDHDGALHVQRKISHYPFLARTQE
jgi:hypothetical protein